MAQPNLAHETQILAHKQTLYIPDAYDLAHIQGVIPHGFRARQGVTDYYAVPHGTAETRVLRNLNIDVPAPIELWYDWPGYQKPFNTQIKTAAMMSTNPRGYVLNQFGAGKTRASLFALDYLYRIGEIRAAIIVAPLSTLSPVWYSEAYTLFNHLNPVVLWGDRKKRKKLLDMPGHHLYIINHDALHILQTELMQREDIDAWVIDELAGFRNPSARRSKVLRELVRGRKYAWGLTGAPTPVAPTDAWMQCNILTPHTVPSSFRRFRDQTMLKVSTFRWVPKAEAKQIVYEAMQPSVCFTRAESYTIPDTVYMTHEPPLSKKQEQFYDAMMKHLRLQYANHEITAANEGVKLGKLLQVSCGYVYDDKSDTILLDPKDRLAATRELIEEADNKAIVFVPYVHTVHHVAEYLRNYYDVAVVFGDTKKTDRDEIFMDFQQQSKPEVIVAHPGCMSHGLTLTKASVVIWYGVPPGHETYVQACARITRASQENVPVVVHLATTRAEQQAYTRLKNQQAYQGALLELFETQEE